MSEWAAHRSNIGKAAAQVSMQHVWNEGRKHRCANKQRLDIGRRVSHPRRASEQAINVLEGIEE
jgi:hypothetical protein